MNKVPMNDKLAPNQYCINLDVESVLYIEEEEVIELKEAKKCA